MLFLLNPTFVGFFVFNMIFRFNSIQFWIIILLFISSMQGQDANGLISDFHQKKIDTQVIQDNNFNYKKYNLKESDNIISRSEYTDRLYGFWLGQCIANWTGLITEMDKIGNVGEIKTGRFYTREDWGKPDHPNIWSTIDKKDSTVLIDFVLYLKSHLKLTD